MKKRDLVSDAKINDYISGTRKRRLLKKSKKGFARVVFSRAGIFALLFLAQVFFFLFFVLWSQTAILYFLPISITFGAVMSIFVLNNSRIDSSAKLTWLFLIMLVPAFGSAVYLFTRADFGNRKLKRQVRSSLENLRGMAYQDPETLIELESDSPETYSLCKYLNMMTQRPVFKGTRVTYFPSGESNFPEMIEQLQMAQHFIFMEFFIIDEGDFFGSVLEILAQKAAAGVEVRIMYDGMNEFNTLSHDYPKRLAELGIKARVFTRIKPFLSSNYNYRDHRKNLIIDGRVVFTGGVNLADEYINRRERFGYWKDNSVMFEGPIVDSFTQMFLEMWTVYGEDPESPERYFGKYDSYPDEKGYAIAFGDIPLDSDKDAENIILSMINRADRYVHIMTPYLILDGELQTALCNAALRGVDVSILIPGIPDKKIPYALAKTHYKALYKAGVKVYEFTPGFLHAKAVVVDDIKALVGTVNLDYRSLYHHFECSVYMYKMGVIGDIERDFASTRDRCTLVDENVIKAVPWGVRLTGYIAKTFAPLL